MKVIFLDIDGVLNHQGYLNDKKQAGKELIAKPEDWYGPHQIDPEKTVLLNRIVEETGAVVVICSTWRKRFSRTEMQDILYERGFTGRLWDFTPSPFQKSSGRWSSTGDEIAKWLAKARAESPGADLVYVVLDDNDIHNAQVAPCHVRTSMERGLEEYEVEWAIRMLNLKVVCPECGLFVYRAELPEGGHVILDVYPRQLYTLATHKVHGTVGGYGVHYCPERGRVKE
jgi:hypothetical protein